MIAVRRTGTGRALGSRVLEVRRLVTVLAVVGLAGFVAACGEDDADPPAPNAVAPAGAGVDREEAQSEERPIVVAGLRYDVLTAQRLNANILPSSELLSGRKPPAGTVWFGVFLRVCNATGQTQTPSSRLALVDAFGGRLEPSSALPSSNPFVYDPEPLDGDACLPLPGSVAERGGDGALVLFAAPPDVLRNRPLALEVTGPDGVRKRVIVDL